MADSLALQNFTSSLTGNLPKAILFVRSVSDAMEGLPDDLDIDISKMAKEDSSASDLREMLYDKVTENALKGAAQTFKSLGISEGSLYEGFVAMEVQYNPNSIHLDTQAGKQVTNSQSGLDQANGQITELFQTGATNMSFELVFDDMNAGDAFMMSSLTSKGLNLIKKSKGEVFSVKKQIDGLMSLLTSPLTRQVVFFWSKMCFRGELTNASAAYTMFNPSGHPIRGVVQLNIRQGSNSEKDFDYTADEEYWREAFDRAFAGQGVTGSKSTADKFMQNNFLNLNI